MPDQLRDLPDLPENTASPLTADDPAPPEGALGQRQKAWLGMGAVLTALVLLTRLPGGEVDPNAPPPVADAGGEAPLSGADSGLSAVGMDAPLHFTLKDVNGIEVKLASFK